MTPVGFPVGSNDTSGLASPNTGSRPNSPTTLKSKVGKEDSDTGRRAAKRSYITRAQLREIENRLSQRDRNIVGDVARLQLMSGQQVRRLHYEDSARGRRLARRALAQLVEFQLLARLDRRIGGVRSGSDGFVYGLGVAGQRLMHPDRRRYRAPWTPAPAYLAHALAVTELGVELEERTQLGKPLLTKFAVEPSCWRRFNGPGGRALVLKPDAYVICVFGAYEDRHFIEVDRSTEALPRIIEKGRLYGRYWQSGREQDAAGIYPQVLWVAPDEHRQAQIVEALGRLDPDYWQLFAVTTNDQAAEVIAGGISSWGSDQ
jgi:Replication-relaxation